MAPDQEPSSEISSVDGFDDPFWTLEQVLAWIITLNRDLVTQISAEDDQATRGFLLSVLLQDDKDGLFVRKKSIAVATRELFRALQSGKLAANGMENSSTSREDINRNAWINLKVYFDGSYLPYIGTKTYPHNWIFTEIRFDREVILANWPEENHLARSSPNSEDNVIRSRMLSTSASEQKAISLVSDLLSKDPELTKLKTREALNRAEIPVSGSGFNYRVWPKAREKAGLSPLGKPGARRRRGLP